MDRNRAKRLLKDFDLTTLFVEQLGWDRRTQRLEVAVGKQTYKLDAVAHKRDMVVFVCGPAADGRMPDYPTRRRIERQVKKSVYEHIIVYADADKAAQKWQWVKREHGKPDVCPEHPCDDAHTGEALLQKLEPFAFTVEEEDGITLTDVMTRVARGLDVERVTKKFYDKFRVEHDEFRKFLNAIPTVHRQNWYASVMLNRLMFVYFIQKKGFLCGDTDYLRNKLAESKRRAADRFYKDFLCPLFFEGFAQREDVRSERAKKLFSGVPYLNGGIFLEHQIEHDHGEAIAIPDAAFDRLFEFFAAYQWHLDDRPLRSDREINPDVLGYIFEKYINAIQPGEQKAKGAYYTKEDITEYIAKSTIIPFLFDAARKQCKIAFEGEQSVWRLLRDDTDRYIYPAVKTGVVEDGNLIPESRLPDFVREGMNDPKKRMFDKRYNLGGAHIPGRKGENLALPTETWRKYIERRQRCLELRGKLDLGEVRDINNLITLNLDVRQFAQDVIEDCEGPELLHAFWTAIAGKAPEKSNEKPKHGISVLDPTCGSGAFLFAALNVLEPLYEACITRMRAFIDDVARSGEKRRPGKLGDFEKTLARVAAHPNERYFIFKSIILNNLFGVDIMDEAVEICKLRLFLKLVAQVDRDEGKPNFGIEPLPDIDFNIRAGNTLVGYVTLAQVREAAENEAERSAGGGRQGRLSLGDTEERIKKIEERANDVEMLQAKFREQQTRNGGEVTPCAKKELQSRLRELEEELSRYLASEYDIDPFNIPRKREYETRYAAWRESHKPFHWFAEFHEIMQRGGFDVVIGNPPYLDLRELTGYTVRLLATVVTRNLYPLVLERCEGLISPGGNQGYIVPVSSVATEGYAALQRLLTRRRLICSCFDDRPAHLFTGLDKNTLSVLLLFDKTLALDVVSSRLCRWSAEERDALFPLLQHHATPKPQLDGCLPKIGSAFDGSLWEKVFSKKKPLALFYGDSSVFVANYSRKVNAFLQVLDFMPKVLDGRGVLRSPSEFKELRFSSRNEATAVFCLLNSTLFRWFMDVVSDGSHLNRREVDNFPFDLAHASVKYPQLNSLGRSLSRSLKMTAETRVMRYRHDTLTVQCIIPKRSKHIIDEIDQVLAKHYGFTDEELDFIINYDIKYRMGADAADDEEEEEAARDEG